MEQAGFRCKVSSELEPVGAAEGHTAAGSSFLSPAARDDHGDGATLHRFRWWSPLLWRFLRKGESDGKGSMD